MQPSDNFNNNFRAPSKRAAAYPWNWIHKFPQIFWHLGFGEVLRKKQCFIVYLYFCLALSSIVLNAAIKNQKCNFFLCSINFWDLSHLSQLPSQLIWYETKSSHCKFDMNSKMLLDFKVCLTYITVQEAFLLLVQYICEELPPLLHCVTSPPHSPNFHLFG